METLTPNSTSEVKLYPPVLIVGRSGTGKSTSIRNLPCDSTIIVNTEKKVLPFKSAKNFKMQVSPKYFAPMGWSPLNPELALDSSSFVYNWFRALQSKADFLVLESWTSTTEMIDDWANKCFTGFDQWKNYNAAIMWLVHSMKQANKQLFVIGIEEWITMDDGTSERHLAVKGKQHRGMIEKEFSIVLWSDVKLHDGKPIFHFRTTTDGERPCKAPHEMFNDILIPNDLLEVNKAIRTYYDE